MSAEPFIARHLKFGGKAAAVAAAVSFFVIIVSVAISSGFRREIRGSLSEMGGDILVEGGGEPISLNEPWVDSLMSIPGVRKVSPVIYRTGILKSGDDIQGVVFKGVESSDTASLVCRIPRRLAEMLDVETGDPLLSYFVGERIQARKFTVSGVYDAVSDSRDRMVVLVGMNDLRRLNGWPSESASALEVAVEDDVKDDMDLALVTQSVAVTSGLMTSSIRERYGNLFDWLDLIDTNVLAILVLMIVVAGFNMISGLLIMLFRSKSAIGTLKAMGMTNRGVAGVFLRVGGRASALGMLAGNVAAFIFCAVQNASHIIKLNPASYFLSYVPVNLDIPSVLAADAVAFIVIEVLLLIPCLFISSVDPAETVRAD